MDFATVFFFSLVLSLLLTPLVRRLMLRLGVLSTPNAHRWHRKPVALMGGIAIFISFVLVMLLRLELKPEILVVMLGGGVIFALGVMDDIFGMHPRIKFALQFLIAFGVVYLGIACRILPYGWLNISFTIFWIVSMMNALNLLDNMDGLSSGITVIAALAISVLSIRKGESDAALLCLALAGSCLGFLRYNFNPARIFMGDCGSMFLGYTLAVLAVLGGWQHSSPLAGTLLSPVLILGVAIFDTTLVTVLRLKNARMPWEGGKDHSSHRLVYILHGKEKGAVLIWYGVGALAGVLGLIAMEFDSLTAILIAAGFCLGMVIFGIRLAKVRCY